MSIGCQLIRKISTKVIKKPYLQWPLKEEAIFPELLNLERYWKDVMQNSATKNDQWPTKYVLAMFPYPSGKLHMGHMRVYTISDTLARYYRLLGFNVLHPIGWDSFGLPAENAAIEAKIDPKEWTDWNIKIMKQQLLRTGIIFDWDAEISTCSPNYYRWTQWIFCKLFEHGLVRRALSEVNWDPIDGTVLAAEQINAEGRSWRSGALVEKRSMKHWMIETPRYAKRLYDGLQQLTQWEEVAAIQAEWIGKCDVWRFLLPLKTVDGSVLEEKLDLRVRDLQLLNEANVVFICRKHPLVRHESGNRKSRVLNIMTHNFVTGRDMHIIYLCDEAPKNDSSPEFILDARLANLRIGNDCSIIRSFGIQSDRNFNAFSSSEEIVQIAKASGFGGYLTSAKLLDWVVSRQRRWGTPIPMLVNEKLQKASPVSYDDLPVVIERNEDCRNPSNERLSQMGFVLEKDTLDTFFDSSWYYLRYLDPNNNDGLISAKSAKMMPVDLYVGGVEHAALHMFYARFISYFLYDMGITEQPEPFRDVLPQGIVCGKTYRRKDNGKYVMPCDVREIDKHLFDKSDGSAVCLQYEKMSKSKHNGIDPLTVLDQFGIDFTRLQLLNEAAPREPINWGQCDVKGLVRWLNKLARLVNDYIKQRKLSCESPDRNVLCHLDEEKYRKVYNHHVRNISMVLEVLHLHNTAIDHLKSFTNALKKVSVEKFGRSMQLERCINSVVIMLQLFTPHLASELWAALCTVPEIDYTSNVRQGDVTLQRWPEVDLDANIDFILKIRDLSCGRVEVPRQLVENCTVHELFHLASEQFHRIIISHLVSLGFQPRNYTRNHREGLYVELVIDYDNSLTEQMVKKALKTTHGMRLKAKKLTIKF